MPNLNPAFKYYMMNADGSNPWQFYPETHYIQPQLDNLPQRCDINISTDYANLVANYHEGALVTIQRDSAYIYRGIVHEFGYDQTNAPNEIRLTCLSKGDSKLDAQAAKKGQDKFAYSYASLIKRLTSISLALLTDASIFNGSSPYPVYPAASTMSDTPSSGSPWIGKSVCRTTTLAANVNDGSTGWTIGDTSHPILVNDWRQIRVPGFIQLGTGASTEIIFVENAYPYIGHSNQGYLDGITRGVLGSSKHAHSSGTQIWGRELKPMANQGSTAIYDSSVLQDASLYQQQYEDARFDFKSDPTSMTLTGDFSVWDTDNATSGMSLATMISDELQEAAPGPALGTGNFDISALETIRIARMVVSEASMLAPVIRRQIDDTFSLASPDTRFIGFDYNPNNDKVRVYSAAQKSTPDWLFWQPQQILGSPSLANLYNTFPVLYKPNDLQDLIDLSRVWHPAVGDTIDSATPGMTNTNTVQAIMYMDADADNAAGWQQDTSGGNAVRVKRLFDRNANTGWGVKCSARFNVDWPTPSQPYGNLLFGWFTAATAIVYDIVAVLDIRNVMPANQFYIFELVGYDSYTDNGPGVPPTLGNEVLIPGDLYYDTSGTYASVTVSAHNLMTEMAAVAVRCGGGTNLVDGDVSEVFLLRDFRVRGVAQRMLRVYYTSSTPNKDQFLAPGAVTRLGTDTRMAPPFDAGNVSEIEARRKARELARKALELNAMKRYILTAGLPSGAIPLKGDTAQVDNAGTPAVFLCHGVGHQLQAGGQEVLELVGVDYTSTTLSS